MSKNFKISGIIVSKAGTPIVGAKIKIWRKIINQQGKPKFIIVNTITDSNGAFKGEALKHNNVHLNATYSYRVEYGTFIKEGHNVLNKVFFKTLNTKWKENYIWKNWLGDLETSIPFQNSKTPSTSKELIEILEDALAKNMTVKFVGSGHSHSKVAQPSKTKSILLNPINLSGKLTNYSWLKNNIELSNSKHQLVRVKAGTTIRTLNREILAPEKLGLINMGPFDGQTISGVINTNTHGSGISMGGFSDMVQSVEMIVVNSTGVDDKVEHWIIEPTNGISDKNKFQEADKFLIQNDDVFFSVVCGYGLFGIVYSYTLEVRDLYWLSENNEHYTWKEVKEEFQNTVDGIPKFIKNNHQSKIYLNTAECIKEGELSDGINCRIDTWNEKPYRVKPKNWEKNDLAIHKIWPPMRPRTANKIFQDLNGLGFDIDGVKNDGVPSKFVINLVNKEFFKKPNKNSFLREYNSSVYYRAIRRTRDDTLKYSHDLKDNEFDNTISTAEPIALDNAVTIEICVPLQSTIDAIEKTMNFISQELDINFIIPTGVRFTKKSKHNLSPTYNRDSAFIEISGWLPSSREKKHKEFIVMYDHALDALEKYLSKEINGVRFHKGKFNTYNVKKFKKHYPKFDVWLSTYKTFNASGVFSCPNSKKWGIDIDTTEPLLALRSMEDIKLV